MFFVFGPLTWVRKIERFRVGFVFGVAMIFVTIIVIAIFCFGDMASRGWSQAAGYTALN